MEKKIRPFVVGRKAWLFSGNVPGARSSAALYSIIETARANDLEPHHYLHYPLENLPRAKANEEYAALLPFTIGPEEMKKTWTNLLTMSDMAKRTC